MTRQLQRIFLILGACLALTTGFAAAQDAPECEPGFRLFTHELLWSETAEGVCIPEQPERIAYSWVFHIPALMREGYPFAGIARRDYVVGQFPAYEEAVLAIPEIELPANLEATLATAPDLIIEPSWAAEDNYEELSAIAPTVAFQFDGTHQWKQLVEMYFELAGMPEGYARAIGEYEARAAELGELIGNPEEIEVSLVWFSDMVNVETNYSSGGILLDDVGFARPAAQIIEQTPEEVIAAGGYPFYAGYSWEEVNMVDGDFIIVAGEYNTEEGAAALAEIQANPLWQALSAVQAGNVYYTSANWLGGDIAGAHNLLDDLAKAFGVYEQFSPNPYASAPGAETSADATEAASS